MRLSKEGDGIDITSCTNCLYMCTHFLRMKGEAKKKKKEEMFAKRMPFCKR